MPLTEGLLYKPNITRKNPIRPHHPPKKIFSIPLDNSCAILYNKDMEKTLDKNGESSLSEERIYFKKG